MIFIITKNDCLDVNITDVTSEGCGVAKPNGYPLFIKGGVTGDVLNVTVTKTNKSYGFAKINKIITPSEYRTEPKCSIADLCGGCDFMHIDYCMQQKIKSDIVKNNIIRIGGADEDSFIYEGIVGGERVFNYRTKAQFPVGMHKGKVVCGFYSRKSHEIVPADNCLIQNEEINKAVKIFLEYANKYKVSVYNEKNHTGILRHIYVRTGHKTGEMLVVIVTNSKKRLPHQDELINALKSLENLKGVLQNINTEKTNLVLGKESRILYGENAIVSQIGNLKFTISAESFFQVNEEQTYKLYLKALEYAELSNNETVFDLYCGVGSISLFLSQKAKKVIGVEIVEKAIENAKHNAGLNGITNAEFYAGDCEKTVGELIQKGESADVVVVDPPRKGCSEKLLEFLNEISPKKIVYVSCNSATLARDIKILSQYGYKLKKVCAVDMFPNSGHCESVALLVRTDSSI